MFEEIVDENDADTSSLHKESEPLYPGASVTLGAVMLLLALFVTKHGLVGDAIQQLLSIIAVALPHENTLCSTVYSFKQFFKNLKNPLIKHFYSGYFLRCQWKIN